ncbi:hypothetical protein [Reyranella sp.]|uniref:hypothetical protein n=1 Tax=Reyranella sp. TaxID=1929291 RepID=UPI003BAB670A
METPKERVAESNRKAAAERRPGDPRPVEPRDSRPLIAIICAGLAIAFVLLGVMYVNSTGETPQPPIAEQR